MKILLVHNKYGKFSGEESVIEKQIDILKGKGIEVKTYFRDSNSIDSLEFGKINAFFSGFYNYRSITELKEIIGLYKPDIVHIHNLFPLVSPAIIPEISKMGIPIVMTVHNYRLMCPNGLFYSKGHICEKCTKGLMELNCVLRNCENSIFKSSGYALRNYWARKKKHFIKNVDMFFCLTEFQRDKMVANGYPSKKMVVLPNFYHKKIIKKREKKIQGDYVGFAGRLSGEKGIDMLLKAAERLPHIQFQLAGGSRKEHDFSSKTFDNVILRGELEEQEMYQFYEKARFLVQPSSCYEGFPMVFPEAMAHGLPIIAPKMGGFPEVVGDDISGLLFKPFDLDSLVSKIDTLWEDTTLCEKLGNRGLLKVENQYSSALYGNELIKNYNKCLIINGSQKFS